MKWPIIVLYVVIVGIGAYFISQRAPSQGQAPLAVTMLAARDLEQNTRLQRDDISVQPAGDYYLQSGVKQGEEIAASQLSPIPTLEVGPEDLWVALSVGPRLVAAGAVIAGRKVRICPADVVVPVQTVLCDASNCLAIVRLKLEDAMHSAAALAGTITPTPPSRPCR